MGSKYKDMRITSLDVKRPILNRLSYWLYEKFCNEPYIPNGKIKITVGKKDDTPASNENKIRITFIPEKFVPGIHEWYLFDKLNCEITFWKDLFK